ncbi:Uncharacterised protein [Bordetella pertussis]|nr:Uncharacterised protein [Bordetella pertussis]
MASTALRKRRARKISNTCGSACPAPSMGAVWMNARGGMPCSGWVANATTAKPLRTF